MSKSINLIHLAAGQDMSGGFEDFFDSIGMTGAGLVTKGVAAVLAVVALTMLFKLINNPKEALRKGGTAVGTLFIAVILAIYGDNLFSTVVDADPGTSQGTTEGNGQDNGGEN